MSCRQVVLLYLPATFCLETASVNVLHVAVLCWKLCHPSEGRDNIHCSNVTWVRVRKEAVQERQGTYGDSRNEQKGRRVGYGAVIAFRSERLLVPLIRREIGRRGQKYRQACD
jgi:hypothetical protein